MSTWLGLSGIRMVCGRTIGMCMRWGSRWQCTGRIGHLPWTLVRFEIVNLRWNRVVWIALERMRLSIGFRIICMTSMRIVSPRSFYRNKDQVTSITMNENEEVRAHSYAMASFPGTLHCANLIVSMQLLFHCWIDCCGKCLQALAAAHTSYCYRWVSFARHRRVRLPLVLRPALRPSHVGSVSLCSVVAVLVASS